MDDKIEYTNKRGRDGHVTRTSRYAMAPVIRWGDRRVLTFPLYRRLERRVATDQDRFTEIPLQFEYRPDLMSAKVYGMVDHWWRLMEANGIDDVFDFVAGRTIRIPADPQ